MKPLVKLQDSIHITIKGITFIIFSYYANNMKRLNIIPNNIEYYARNCG